jgi:hypothetical protein
MGVDGTGSGSCPVAGFGISGVEPWGSATSLFYHQYYHLPSYDHFAESLKVFVFCDVAPCNLVDTGRRFRVACCSNLWDVCEFPTEYTMLHPRRQSCSLSSWFYSGPSKLFYLQNKTVL